MQRKRGTEEKLAEASPLREFGSFLSDRVKKLIPEQVRPKPTPTAAPELKIRWTACDQSWLVVGLLHQFQVYRLKNDPKTFLSPVAVHVHSFVSGFTFIPRQNRANWTQAFGTCGVLTSSSNAGPFPSTSVRLFSIQESKVFHIVRFPSKVFGTLASSSKLAVLLSSEIHVFSLEDMKTSCIFKCFPHPFQNPVGALSSRLIAFAGVDERSERHDVRKAETQVSSVEQAAASVVSIGETGLKTFAEYFSDDARWEEKVKPSQGVVEVWDLKTLTKLGDFVAHSSNIACLSFDSSGSVLVSVSVDGQYVNVYQVISFPRYKDPSCLPHSKPFSSVHGFCRLMYRVFRGVRKARISQISFSNDSKWIVLTSLRGTCHFVAINPTGSIANASSHTRNGHNFKYSHSPIHEEISLSSQQTIKPLHRIRCPPEGSEYYVSTQFCHMSLECSPPYQLLLVKAVNDKMNVLLAEMSCEARGSESIHLHLDVRLRWDLKALIQDTSKLVSFPKPELEIFGPGKQELE
jgi:hypothetical protein